MKNIFTTFLVIICIGCTSSTHYEFNFEESKATIQRKDYIVKISINSTNDFLYPMNSYKLDITNLSDKDIEIDWNKTQFIINKQAHGGFMFNGIRYIAREDIKNPSFVLAKSSFSEFIYPNYLVSYYLQNWRNTTIPDGETGVFLTLKIENKEIREKLFITKTTKIVPNK